MDLYCADFDVPRKQSQVVLQLWCDFAESEGRIGSGSPNKAVTGLVRGVSTCWGDSMPVYQCDSHVMRGDGFDIYCSKGLYDLQTTPVSNLSQYSQ